MFLYFYYKKLHYWRGFSLNMCIFAIRKYKYTFYESKEFTS